LGEEKTEIFFGDRLDKLRKSVPAKASKKDVDARRKAVHDERVLACFRLCSR
jgi:hypothetical protein